MGNVQLLISHKCCNDDLIIDEDDDEKPKVKQLPTITEDKNKIQISESFTTTLPCFTN
jgi:hypothetical protein